MKGKRNTRHKNQSPNNKDKILSLKLKYIIRSNKMSNKRRMEEKRGNLFKMKSTKIPKKSKQIPKI